MLYTRRCPLFHSIFYTILIHVYIYYFFNIQNLAHLDLVIEVILDYKNYKNLTIQEPLIPGNRCNLLNNLDIYLFNFIIKFKNVTLLITMMPGNWCYFRNTFNIFLYIILNPKQIILNLYKTQKQIKNINKFKQFIIRVIDILIIN